MDIMCHQLSLSCSILTVNCSIVSPTQHVNLTLFAIPCNFFVRDYRFSQCCNYRHFPSGFLIQISTLHDNLPSRGCWQEKVGFQPLDGLAHQSMTVCVPFLHKKLTSTTIWRQIFTFRAPTTIRSGLACDVGSLGGSPKLIIKNQK